MPKGRYVHKSKPVQRLPALTEEEGQHVAGWLGEFIPPAKIPQLIFETFGKRVAPNFGHEFATRTKWQSLIDRRRQEYLIKVVEVPLAHTKVRLEKLQTMVNRLENQDGVSPERFERRMLRLLDAARLEMEEKPADQTNIFFTSVNNYSDDELLQRRQELLKRIQTFRWPSTRRVTDGTLRDRREESETPGTDAHEDDGRGHEVLDTPVQRRGGDEPQDGLARQDAGEVNA